jgi:hypothetical protein
MAQKLALSETCPENDRFGDSVLTGSPVGEQQSCHPKKLTPVRLLDFPSLRFKPPPLGGQISSPLFPVHCRDGVRR